MNVSYLTLVEQFATSEQVVLVIGDIMLDRYLTGEVSRISPEAPVPVVLLNHADERLGGAANVVANLRGLGIKTKLLGVIGDDSFGQMLVTKLDAVGTDTSGIVVSKSRPTTNKIRVVSAGHQIVRVDEECIHPLNDAESQALLGEFQQALATQPSLVVLSDYAKGVLDPKHCAAIINACRSARIPVIVDPKGRDYSKYQGATALTPNKKEIAEACGIDVHNTEQLLLAAESLRKQLGLQFLTITRGEEGLSLLQQDQTTHLAATAQSVFDVSGAGDTVIATLATGLAHGLTTNEALYLANIAAGVVVGMMGTVPITNTLLLEALRAGDAPEKLYTLSQLCNKLESWTGLTIVFTNGCFDVLHAGHVSYLKAAKAAGDKLIVGLNTDRSVRALKGDKRPINHEADRAQVLAALNMVDAVVLFDEDTPLQLICALRPQVLVKGDDYQEQDIIGGKEVKSWGGVVKRIALLPGRSTTNTIERLRVW